MCFSGSSKKRSSSLKLWDTTIKWGCNSTPTRFAPETPKSSAGELDLPGPVQRWCWAYWDRMQPVTARGWQSRRSGREVPAKALQGPWNATETLGDQTIAGGFLLGGRPAGVAGYRRGKIVCRRYERGRLMPCGQVEGRLLKGPRIMHVMGKSLPGLRDYPGCGFWPKAASTITFVELCVPSYLQIGGFPRANQLMVRAVLLES